MESFFFLGIGLVIGLVIGVLVMRFVVVSKTLENKSKQFDEIRQIKEDAENFRIKSLEEQQKRFDETLGKVTAELKLATNEMLKQRQKEFAETSENNLSHIVNPLKESINKMKETMQNATLKQTEMSAALKTELEQAKRLSEAAKSSAEELSRVFRHKGKVQGDWGETILNELLEKQGLKLGVHFETQVTIRDASGNTIKTDDDKWLRPDVILHLDSKREVIIDSKVSLSAFMDYVIMFVPHAGAVFTALNSEQSLWREAMEKNVFIADEQTLYAALRIVNLMWRQESQIENHKKVYDLAEEMLDRVGQFYKKYQDIGKALETAQKKYDEADKKLTPHGQSIMQTCNKLIHLGAKQSKTNSLPLLDSESEE
jgi:DNA recombination protein RmuC